MRFSSAIVLAVIANLASSISAAPDTADVEKCRFWCTNDFQCCGNEVCDIFFCV
ncbi:hypothetical protein P692DRAFT_20827578, partial [Suillus brevipes Sb2]